MNRTRTQQLITALIMMCIGCFSANALSLSLDSVSEWGRFPKFCVDVYRWGDGFFNGYDTAYVIGAGHRFNAKLTTDTRAESYNFYFPNRVRMQSFTDPSVSVGARLTYLAVSVGYDKNVNHFFGGKEEKRKEEFTFGFNCSLFAFNMYFNDNKGGTTIRRFGRPGETYKPDLDFDGLHSRSFGFEAGYFFNHKKYSQAAAFSFSRIQVRSQGSWFAGLSYSTQTFDFDFSGLPEYMRKELPQSWTDYRYGANSKDIGLKIGYGYNWVFAPKWLLAVSESPSLGLKIGTFNDPSQNNKTNVAFSNRFKASVVWNHKPWFAGAVAVYDTALFYDKETIFQNSNLSLSLQVGYRFDLW